MANPEFILYLAFFVGEDVFVGVGVPVLVFVPVTVDVRDFVAVFDAVGVLLGVNDAVGVLVPVIDPVRVFVGVTDAVIERVADNVALRVDVAAAVKDAVALPVAVGDTISFVGDAEIDIEAEHDCVAAAVDVFVATEVRVDECVGGRVPVGDVVCADDDDADDDGDVVAEGVSEAELEDECVDEGDGDVVAAALGELARVEAAEAVLDLVLEKLDALVAEFESVLVIDAEALADGEVVVVEPAVPDAETDGVSETLLVFVDVRDAVVDRVGVALGVCDGVCDGVAVRVGEFDGDTMYCAASSFRLNRTWAAVSAASYTRRMPMATFPPSMVPTKL